MDFKAKLKSLYPKFPKFFYQGCRYLQVESWPAVESGPLPIVERLNGVAVFMRIAQDQVASLVLRHHHVNAETVIFGEVGVQAAHQSWERWAILERFVVTQRQPRGQHGPDAEAIAIRLDLTFPPPLPYLSALTLYI